MGAAETLAQEIVALARGGELDLDADARTWKSGVYALVDAVFRARARYATTVLPLLEERLPARPGLRDRMTLTFRELLADVATFGRDAVERHEAYARDVLNRQRLGGRLKVEICCDAAAALSARGLETGRKLRTITPAAWETLVREDLTRIPGFGGLLSRHLAAALGRLEPQAPEPRALRFATQLVAEAATQPAEADPPPVDAACLIDALERAAIRLDVSLARLDVALHRRAAEGPRKGGASDGARPDAEA